MNNTDSRNMGHGHVTPRPDGYRSRCGGPAICVVCQRERAAFEATTQPPQDERGQRLSAWQISERMPTCHRQRTSLENINDVLEVISAEPARPVALSTLTEFEHWLNARRGLPVAEVFHEIVEKYRAASAPAQQAGPSYELLGIVRTAMAQANVIIKADGDKGDRSQAMMDLPLTLRVIETAVATPPQPVAAEVAIAPKLLLERAAEMCEWYAEFIRENVMSVDIERHPYRPELEGIAEDLRALSGTGSDESKKESGNGL